MKFLDLGESSPPKLNFSPYIHNCTDIIIIDTFKKGAGENAL